MFLDGTKQLNIYFIQILLSVLINILLKTFKNSDNESNLNQLEYTYFIILILQKKSFVWRFSCKEHFLLQFYRSSRTSVFSKIVNYSIHTSSTIKTFCFFTIGQIIMNKILSLDLSRCNRSSRGRSISKAFANLDIGQSHC